MSPLCRSRHSCGMRTLSTTVINPSVSFKERPFQMKLPSVNQKQDLYKPETNDLSHGIYFCIVRYGCHWFIFTLSLFI